MARVLRITGTLFIGIGLLILLFVLYELVGTTAITRGHQNTLRNEFVQVVAEPSPTSPPDRPARRAVRAPAIAHLRIPRIGVDVIVVDGVTLNDLAWGPGHYPSTADIGSKGASAIAGHRTGWGAPFFNLDRLRAGDPVILETSEGTFTYRITDSTIVHPADVWVLAGNPASKATRQLVLTTCTPKFTSRDRLIYFADLVGSEPRAARSEPEAA